MWIFGLSPKEYELLKTLREYAGRFEMATTVLDLKKQIAELEINKGKLKEDHDREQRELRHMIGLEKKRQEFEVEKAKQETSLKVREENLSADKKRFEQQMKFHEDRFTEEVKYLKDLMGQVLERLPNVTATFDGGKRK
jgi:hypothetical protein